MDEKAPREADFDALLDLLRPLDSGCAAVFNCQGRRSDSLAVSPGFAKLNLNMETKSTCPDPGRISLIIVTIDGEGPHHHGNDHRVPGQGRRPRTGGTHHMPHIGLKIGIYSIFKMRFAKIVTVCFGI